MSFSWIFVIFITILFLSFVFFLKHNYKTLCSLMFLVLVPSIIAWCRKIKKTPSLSWISCTISNFPYLICHFWEFPDMLHPSKPPTAMVLTNIHWWQTHIVVWHGTLQRKKKGPNKQVNAGFNGGCENLWTYTSHVLTYDVLASVSHRKCPL